MKPLDLLIVCSLACALVSTGCTTEKSAELQVLEQQSGGHDHNHDHGIPDHKPVSLADAVNQMPKRHALTISEFSAGHVDRAEQELRELNDFVRWLPELAADSDLGEIDWNLAQSISLKMEEIGKRWSASQSNPNFEDSESFLTLIGQLKPLAEKADLAHLDWSGIAARDTQN